jgi:orotate phosphoribosyltransferase
MAPMLPTAVPVSKVTVAGCIDAAVSERTTTALREAEALLDGHFLLSSGRHAGRYIQCARLLQYPTVAGKICDDLAGVIRAAGLEFDVVLGPAMGAVTFSYELARALGVRGVFAERVPEGGFALRRGFEIQPGERVLVAEDVVTTGKSAKEVLAMLKSMGAPATGVASIANRSGKDNPFEELPYFRCVDLDVPSWEPDSCALCADPAMGPAIKPGSRPQAE